MNIYVVSLNDSDEDAWERLKTEWSKPEHLVVTKRLAFIAAKEGITAEEVSDIVGMNEEHKVSGIVSRAHFSTINGWNRQAVWQWLEDNQ